jgi:hypothetical protein
MEYLINKLFQPGEVKDEMLRRVISHDMDKIVMYQFMNREDASAYHKKTSSHHMANNIPKTYYDKLEAVLDYESAGYTKPDKPLNAFDTINRMRNDGIISEKLYDELMIICKGLRVAKSYSVTDDIVGMQCVSKYSEVTEDMIKEDVMRYFQSHSNR